MLQARHGHGPRMLSFTATLQYPSNYRAHGDHLVAYSVGFQATKTGRTPLRSFSPCDTGGIWTVYDSVWWDLCISRMVYDSLTMLDSVGAGVWVCEHIFLKQAAWLTIAHSFLRLALYRSSPLITLDIINIH